jgi:hypothetical protein
MMVICISVLIFSGCSKEEKNNLTGVWINVADSRKVIAVDESNKLYVYNDEGTFVAGTVEDDWSFVLNYVQGDYYFEYELKNNKLYIKDEEFATEYFLKAENEYLTNIEDLYGKWKNDDFELEINESTFVLEKTGSEDNELLAHSNERLEEISYNKIFDGALGIVKKNEKIIIPYFYDKDSEKLYFHGLNFSKFDKVYIEYLSKIYVSPLFDPRYPDGSNREFIEEIFEILQSEQAATFIADSFKGEVGVFKASYISTFATWIDKKPYKDYYNEDKNYFCILGKLNDDFYQLVIDYDVKTKKLILVNKEILTEEENLNYAKVYDDWYKAYIEDQKNKKTEKDNNLTNIKEANDLSGFIPDGWRILNAYGDETVEGDLNKDQINDIAFVIEEDSDEIDRKRKLIVLFGNGDSNYEIVATSDKAVRREDEGGVMGDPFAGLEIERGSLLIHHYGGSAWRWGDSFRFRYQDNDFYLIGASSQSFHAATEANREFLDINLITGKYILDTTDEEGEWSKEEGKNEPKELIKLTGFDVRDTEEVFNY